jgi:hypothetical protein
MSLRRVALMQRRKSFRPPRLALKNVPWCLSLWVAMQHDHSWYVLLVIPAMLFGTLTERLGLLGLGRPDARAQPTS